MPPTPPNIEHATPVDVEILIDEFSFTVEELGQRLEETAHRLAKLEQRFHVTVSVLQYAGSPFDIVNALHYAVLGCAPTDAGMRRWTEQLNDGLPLITMIDHVIATRSVGVRPARPTTPRLASRPSGS